MLKLRSECNCGRRNCRLSGGVVVSGGTVKYCNSQSRPNSAQKLPFPISELEGHRRVCRIPTAHLSHHPPTHDSSRIKGTRMSLLYHSRAARPRILSTTPCREAFRIQLAGHSRTCRATPHLSSLDSVGLRFLCNVHYDLNLPGHGPARTPSFRACRPMFM